MLNFQEFPVQETIEEEEEPVPSAEVTVVEEGERYGKFVVEPLPKGYGMTLGNPLRRVLYNSLPGTAVTWVKIEGALHEYATIPHVKEEVVEILLNVKEIRLRSEVDRPGKLRLEVAGRGEVCAGDIMASADFDVVNPELHLATLDSDEARLSVEFNVERSVGFAEGSRSDGLPIGVLPIDAIYTPIRKVNFTVSDLRVGQRTDFEQLQVEIWTDGSVTPVEAMRQAGNILVERFFLFANTRSAAEEGSGATPMSLKISPEHYNVPVERLELSSRTLNCLKRAGINKVGEVLEMKSLDLLEIRNFGEKSLTELYERLREMSLLPAELDPALQASTGEEDGETGNVADDGEAGLAVAQAAAVADGGEEE